MAQRRLNKEMFIFKNAALKANRHIEETWVSQQFFHMCPEQESSTCTWKKLFHDVQSARQLNNTESLVLSGKKKKKKLACVILLKQTRTFQLYIQISFLNPATNYTAEFKLVYCMTWESNSVIYAGKSATLSKTFEKQRVLRATCNHVNDFLKGNILWIWTDLSVNQQVHNLVLR